MHRAACLAAAAAGATLPFAAAQPQGACFYDSRVGATFDATALANSTTDYIWTDLTDIYTVNTTYYFNFCQNTVSPLPPSCLGPGKGVGPAFQVRTAVGDCYRLGYDMTARPTFFAKALIDTNYPAEGWTITYQNGEMCSNGQTSLPRTFTMTLNCGHHPFPPAGVNTGSVFNLTTFIDETNTCEYTAYSWSLAGCPLECPLVNGMLCGGNGVCGYDDNIQSARCFCYDDWIEKDCQSPRTPKPSGAIAGAVIGGLLLGALIVLGYAYWAGRRSTSGPTGQVDAFYGKI